MLCEQCLDETLARAWQTRYHEQRTVRSRLLAGMTAEKLPIHTGGAGRNLILTRAFQVGRGKPVCLFVEGEAWIVEAGFGVNLSQQEQGSRSGSAAALSVQCQFQQGGDFRAVQWNGAEVEQPAVRIGQCGVCRHRLRETVAGFLATVLPAQQVPELDQQARCSIADFQAGTVAGLRLRHSTQPLQGLPMQVPKLGHIAVLLEEHS